MQTFHSLIFKSFALYMIGALYDQCHYWTQANIEQLLNVHKTLPKQSDVVLNVSYETKIAENGQRTFLMHTDRNAEATVEHVKLSWWGKQDL